VTPQPRLTAFRLRLPAPLAVVLLVAAWGLASLAAAQQIPYTVHVVALSDRDAALNVVGDLLRQGFPAYVVRSTSAQGDVFRVRVGAFANRLAALRYAEAMPQVAGGQPVPALAEAIPPGITPLAPRLLLEEPMAGLDVRLLRVGGELVVRAQQRTPLAPADYLVLTAGGGVERLSAWQLSEDATGARVWVRDMPLWPDTWREEPEEVREGYRSSFIGLVAERLDLAPEEVEAAQYSAGTGVPHLVVVERVSPGATEGPELLGLGLPASGMTPSGPLAYLGVDPELLPGLPDGVWLDLASGAVRGQLAPGGAGSADGAGGDVVGANEAGGDPAGPVDAGDTTDATGAEAAEAAEADAAEPRVQPTAPAEGAESGEAAEETEDTEDTEEAEEAEEAPAPPEAAGAGEVDVAGDGVDVAEVDAAPEGGTVVAGDGWRATPDGPFVRLTVTPSAEGARASSWRAAYGTPLWSDGQRLVAHVGQVLLVYDFLPRD